MVASHSGRFSQKRGVFLILVPALSHPLSFLVVYLYYIGRAHIDSIYILNSDKLDNSNKNVVFMKKTSFVHFEECAMVR